MIRIVAVDEHSVVLEMLAKAIGKHKDIQLVGSAIHDSMLPDLVEQHRPHVAILGIRVDVSEHQDALGYLRNQHPKIKILLLGGYDVDPARADELSQRIDDTIQSLAAGNILYQLMPKDSASLNNPPMAFTQQEKSALELLLYEGKSVKTTAQTLGISEESIHNLMEKMLDNAGIKAPKSPRVRLRHKKRPAGPA